MWPPLPLDSWRDTYATLHLWTQIVGKIRMACTPPVNHFWHVPLYVTARGLTTSPMPRGEDGTFEIELDLVHHNLLVTTDRDELRAMPLIPRSVANFQAELFALLRALGIAPHITDRPVEVPDRTPFSEDEKHCSYDADAAHRCWQALVGTDRVLKAFRGRFLGKASPVHFFWGSFDLALTFFSGRRAPPRAGMSSIDREAYSHEVASFGFWPGGVSARGVPMDEPVFYAYAAPEPAGFAEAQVRPREAYYHRDHAELFLPYEAVRRASSPDEMLTAFFESAYVNAATLGGWDRAALERTEKEARAEDEVDRRIGPP